MKVKVDTKEKFSVVTPLEGHFSVIMAEEITSNVIAGFQKPAKSAIVSFVNITSTEQQALIDLATLSQLCQKNNVSFVLCAISVDVQNQFKELNLWEALNITPTESEAWDIVQMEEIEREFLQGEGDK